MAITTVQRKTIKIYTSLAEALELAQSGKGDRLHYFRFNKDAPKRKYYVDKDGWMLIFTDNGRGVPSTDPSNLIRKGGNRTIISEEELLAIPDLDEVSIRSNLETWINVESSDQIIINRLKELRILVYQKTDWDRWKAKAGDIDGYKGAGNDRTDLKDVALTTTVAWAADNGVRWSLNPKDNRAGGTRVARYNMFVRKSITLTSLKHALEVAQAGEGGRVYWIDFADGHSRRRAYLDDDGWLLIARSTASSPKTKLTVLASMDSFQPGQDRGGIIGEASYHQDAFPVDNMSVRITDDTRQIIDIQSVNKKPASRVVNYKTLAQAKGDEKDWKINVLSPGASIQVRATPTTFPLTQSIYQAAGNASGLHWVPRSRQVIVKANDASTRTALNLWVRYKA